MEFQDYNRKVQPNWCPGCGDFGVLNALKMSLAELGIPPHKVLIVSGIGCSSKLPHWINAYGFHTLHGRPLPTATGATLVNKDLTVIAVSGDGDAYGLGVGHFMHTLRRNPNIAYLVLNNMIYGLTKGQTSPTSLKGFVSNSTPDGAIEEPFNPIATAIAGGGSFVARGFSDDIKGLQSMITEAIKHKGFGFVDVLQPCVSFNKVNTREWYQKKIYQLTKQPKTKQEAFVKGLEEVKMPVGIFWQEDKSVYKEQVALTHQTSIVKQDINSINLDRALARLK